LDAASAAFVARTFLLTFAAYNNQLNAVKSANGCDA